MMQIKAIAQMQMRVIVFGNGFVSPNLLRHKYNSCTRGFQFLGNVSFINRLIYIDNQLAGIVPGYLQGKKYFWTLKIWRN